MTIPLQCGLVYGPVASRRLGRSLGVNVLPEGCKACNFNCPYCQYGWTPGAAGGRQAAWPAPADVAAAVAEALEQDASVDRITLAGNGEPTLHPRLGEIVRRLASARDAHAPGARLAVLSNSSTLGSAAAVAALRALDERYMKLDAGDDRTLKRINRSPVPIDAIVTGLCTLGGVVVQSMFTRSADGRIDNTTSIAVAAWLAAIERVRPLAVHIYTIDRDPAWQALERVPRPELEAIAARVAAAGGHALVFE